MAKKDLTETLIAKTEDVYSRLITSSDESLTKAEIIEILGAEYGAYYTFVVQGLADLKKAVRNRGYHGGITVNYGIKGLRQKLTDSNRKALVQYFGDAPLQTTQEEKPVASEKQDAKLEADFYNPLKDYLERSGLYEIVSVNPKLQGSKWENADLASVSYETDLRYHSTVDLRLNAFEVKRGFPSVENIQQTAAYLLYANASYICYYDDRFKGTNIDLVVQRLRDEGIWDLLITFGLGAIVSYRAQEKGSNLYFQTVREAPLHPVEPIRIERGIELWLDEPARSLIRKELVRQTQRISTLLD